MQPKLINHNIQGLDAACGLEDPAPLSNALETRVLPWLGKLREMLLRATSPAQA